MGHGLRANGLFLLTRLYPKKKVLGLLETKSSLMGLRPWMRQALKAFMDVFNKLNRVGYCYQLGTP